jgi:pimeloyl-ACP methyl ester carboxylesterase
MQQPGGAHTHNMAARRAPPPGDFTATQLRVGATNTITRGATDGWRSHSSRGRSHSRSSRSRSRSRRRRTVSWQQHALKRLQSGTASCAQACVRWALRLLVAVSVACYLAGKDPFAGQTLAGLPNPPGALVQLSYGPTHYQLRIPAPRSNETADREAEASTFDGGRSANHGVEPLVVCIHGAGTHSYVWQALANELVAAHKPVLVFDLWGHGHSVAPDARYNVDLFVGQLTELLAALHLEGPPLVLVGAQLGAVVATRFAAARKPRSVHGLVLLGQESSPTLGGNAEEGEPGGTNDLWGGALPLTSAILRWMPHPVATKLMGLTMGRELHHWLARCHTRPTAALPAGFGRATFAGSMKQQGQRSFAKWLALAAVQWRRAGFVRAISSLMVVARDAAEVTNSVSKVDGAASEVWRPAPSAPLYTLRFVQGVSRNATPPNEVRRRLLGVGHDGGGCGEAGLREEAAEVATTMLSWLETVAIAESTAPESTSHGDSKALLQRALLLQQREGLAWSTALTDTLRAALHNTTAALNVTQAALLASRSELEAAATAQRSGQQENDIAASNEATTAPVDQAHQLEHSSPDSALQAELEETYAQLRMCASDRVRAMHRMTPLVERVTAKWSGHVELKQLVEEERRAGLLVSSSLVATPDKNRPQPDTRQWTRNGHEPWTEL